MSWIMLFLLYIFLDCFLGKKTDAKLLVVNDVLYCVPFCDEQKINSEFIDVKHIQIYVA